MRTRGSITAYALVIIMVVIVGAFLYSYVLNSTRPIYSIEKVVLGYDYESMTGSYGDSVLLNFDGILKPIPWDGKAVAAVAATGERYRVGYITYMTEFRGIYKNTYTGNDLFACYEVTIEDVIVQAPVKTDSDVMKIEFSLSQWNSLDVGIKTEWIEAGAFIHYRQDGRVTVYLPIKSYNVYYLGEVVFREAPRYLFICGGYSVVRTDYISLDLYYMGL